MKKLIFIIPIVITILFLFEPHSALAQGTFGCMWLDIGECQVGAINCESEFTYDYSKCSAINLPGQCNSANFTCVRVAGILRYEDVEGFEKFVEIFGPTREMNIGAIISRLLPYVFVLAGLILFGFLIFSGFELLMSAGNPERVKLAQGKITSAVIGFVIIFAAYWIVQILETIFGIEIFGV